MSRIFQWKKSIPAFLAAVFLAAGAMGGHMVTAWATPVSGTVNADGVRIRNAAVDGDLLGTLSDGEEVSIDDETTGSDGMTWYQITYETDNEEITGWVRSDFLDTSDDEIDSDTETADEPEVSYIVADSIPDDVIPDGFEETTITYLEEEVPALYSEACDISLLYAVNSEDETDAGLFVYDEQNEAWIPFVQFEMQDGFVILLSIPEDEQETVADRFVLTECVFEHGSISAYQLSEPDELVAADASIVDYYYMYGVNEIGETGWYVYHLAEGSIQKNVTSMQYSLTSTESAGDVVETDADADSSFSMDSVTRMSIAILAVICILLLILAVIFSVRYRRLRNILEDETEGPVEYREYSEPEKRQQEPAEPVSKKSFAESRDNLPRRKGEPVERRIPSDDMDVMDLDSMEDEDYEALLNKYLDENFADEKEESGHPAGDDPDALPEHDTWIDDLEEEDISPFEKNAAGASVPDTGRDNASSSKEEPWNSLSEDYDMPEFRKTDGDTQGSDDMELDISGTGKSTRKSHRDSNHTDYNMESALSSKK